jgi:hypothetical protein
MSGLLELFINVIGEFAEVIVGIFELLGCVERPISRKLFNSKSRVGGNSVPEGRKKSSVVAGATASIEMHIPQR